MKKQRGSSLAPIIDKPNRNSNQFRSARHSSHIEPSKKYNQYLVRNQDYGTAASPAPNKKMSHDRGFPSASEADKESN